MIFTPFAPRAGPTGGLHTITTHIHPHTHTQTRTHTHTRTHTPALPVRQSYPFSLSFSLSLSFPSSSLYCVMYELIWVALTLCFCSLYSDMYVSRSATLLQQGTLSLSLSLCVVGVIVFCSCVPRVGFPRFTHDFNHCSDLERAAHLRSTLSRSHSISLTPEHACPLSVLPLRSSTWWWRKDTPARHRHRRHYPLPRVIQNPASQGERKLGQKSEGFDGREIWGRCIVCMEVCMYVWHGEEVEDVWLRWVIITIWMSGSPLPLVLAHLAWKW